MIKQIFKFNQAVFANFKTFTIGKN